MFYQIFEFYSQFGQALPNLLQIVWEREIGDDDDPFFMVISFCKLEVLIKYSNCTYWRHLRPHNPSTKIFCVFEELLHHTEKHRYFVAYGATKSSTQTSLQFLYQRRYKITQLDTEKVLQNHLAIHRKGATESTEQFYRRALRNFLQRLLLQI